VSAVGASDGGSAECARGKVLIVEPLGREDLVVVDIDGEEVRLLVDKSEQATLGHNMGLVFNGDKVQFFDPETEMSLLWS
ncbi:MAG: hypothetical protein IIB04_02510, partial [Acidobacteria bacterium]|nr:hypothetical protein [Acidobacteriota bacterium]